MSFSMNDYALTLSYVIQRRPSTAFHVFIYFFFQMYGLFYFSNQFCEFEHIFKNFLIFTLFYFTILYWFYHTLA